jgi:hypothetical protein
MSDLTHEEFLRLYMEKKGSYKEGSKRQVKSLHTVWSHFNKDFREYFGEDPVEAMDRLDKEGKVVIRLVKRGALLYLPEDYNPIFDKDGLRKRKDDIR